MTTENKTLEKRTSHAFGKDIYLLGQDKSGDLLWLEAASWDCSWYWGFGYIERYTNNERPDLARDAKSHTHWDSEIVGKHEHYDFDKKAFVLNPDYIHHLNDNPNIEKSVLTESESWELADLMQSFYTLQKTAKLYHSGNSHITSSVNVDLKNQEEYDRINKVLMPQIFKRVYEILTPAENT